MTTSEIKIETTKQGYKFISVTIAEVLAWGGLGICDSCNKSAGTGKYIPVLNSYYCQKCFDEWQAIAKYYPEDMQYEAHKLESMVERLQQ